MNKTIKSERLPRHLLEEVDGLLESCIKKQRVELFKQLDIKDDQPIVLTFKSTNPLEHNSYSADPLADIELRTTVNVEYPATRHVVINKCMHENYIEHKGFWSKLKLLFSKKPIYTREVK